VYTSGFDPSRGAPPYAFAITNRPDELFNDVMDVLERVRADTVMPEGTLVPDGWSTAPTTRPPMTPSVGSAAPDWSRPNPLVLTEDQRVDVDTDIDAFSSGDADAPPPGIG
jgi:hypothetical protein